MLLILFNEIDIFRSMLENLQHKTGSYVGISCCRVNLSVEYWRYCYVACTLHDLLKFATK